MKTVGNVPVETVRFLILNGSMNLPLYVRILPPIYAPIVWLVCTWNSYFEWEDLCLPVSCLALRLVLLGNSVAWTFLRQQMWAIQPDLFELHGLGIHMSTRTFDRRKSVWKFLAKGLNTGMISCIIPNYTHVFFGEVTNNLHKRFPANFWGISRIQDGFFIGHLYIYTTEQRWKPLMYWVVRELMSDVSAKAKMLAAKDLRKSL